MRVGPENDGNCNYGISKSCPTFTSVRTAAQAFPFSELRWENFETLNRIDLEGLCGFLCRMLLGED